MMLSWAASRRRRRNVIVDGLAMAGERRSGRHTWEKSSRALELARPTTLHFALLLLLLLSLLAAGSRSRFHDWHGSDEPPTETMITRDNSNSGVSSTINIKHL